jgi:5-methyltetrahydropteroyltriglutamate--homocysteine methyltransferase
MMKLPLFPVTVVGSWPRPPWLLDARKRGAKDLPDRIEEATLLALKQQEDAGIDIVADGEQRRDNFCSFIADSIDGMKLLSMADLLEHVEDKAAFEGILGALDVPAFAIRNATVVGKLRAVRPLALDDFRFARAHTRKPIKVALPGPYLITRSSWVAKLSGAAYPTREELGDDVVKILRDEVRTLAAAGADMIQLDEPVLSELAFAGKSTTHTFMCGALAAQASPEKEFDLAVSLVNRVFEGVRGTLRALHICRGNWSRDEAVLLSGGYAPLLPHLGRMDVDQFVLEYATDRAGPVEALKQLPQRAQVGFGVVNPRTAEVEPPEKIAARVREVAKLLGPDRIFLNPDCGFGTFADRPVNNAATAARKLESLACAAEMLRREY